MPTRPTPFALVPADLAAFGVRLFRIAVGLAVLIVLARRGALRASLVVLDPAIVPLLVLAALGGAAWHGLVRLRRRPAERRAVKRRERRLGRALAEWGWVPSIVFCLLPLWAHWEGRPPEALTAWSAALGHIPWADARSYLEGGQQLLAEGSFGAQSERKPLHAAWLAVRLALARGSVPGALEIQAAALGLALFLAARLIGMRYGVWPALFCYAVVLALARGVLPAVVTQPFGLTFAALALGILVSGWARRDERLFAGGLGVLALALQVRPGAQILLPLLLAWAFVHFRGRRTRALVWGLAALVAATAVTGTLNRCYGIGQASFNTRPALTLYGLARGGDYLTAEKDFGERLQQFPTERESAHFLYGEAWREIRARPEVFVGTLLSNTQRTLEKAGQSLAYVLNVSRLMTVSLEEQDGVPLTWGHWILGLTLALGVWRIVRSRERLFWAAIAAGTLASGAFVALDLGFHGVVVAYPMLGLGLGLALGGRFVPQRTLGSLVRDERRLVRWSLAVAAGLTLTALVGPALARPTWPRPAREWLAGREAGHDLVIAMESSAAVAVGKGGLPQREYQHLLRIGGLLDLPPFSTEEPPFVLLSAYDFVTHRQQIVFAPPDLAGESGFVALTAERIPAFRGREVYRASAWQRLGPWR
jgi:hypothetical protein